MKTKSLLAPNALMSSAWVRGSPDDEGRILPMPFYGDCRSYLTSGPLGGCRFI